jgi:DNA-directed RNA polymerase subunit RPC12/RpoP
VAVAMEKNNKQVWSDKNLGVFMLCEYCGKSGTLVTVRKEHVAFFRGRKFKRIVVGYRCMDCHKSFINPQEDELLEKDYQKFVIKVDKETKNYTCLHCSMNRECKYAWDLYNTNGDCLANK